MRLSLKLALSLSFLVLLISNLGVLKNYYKKSPDFLPISYDIKALNRASKTRFQNCPFPIELANLEPSTFPLPEIFLRKDVNRIRKNLLISNFCPGKEPPEHKAELKIEKENFYLEELPGDPVFFKIKNTGKSEAAPHFSINGLNWTTSRAILSQITEPRMTDKGKALKIWNFIVENRNHFSPASGGAELHDPVKLFNIYGYGLCDDSATSMMLLSELSGLKSRVYFLGGHVVSEVYYDSSWHMFDPDGEVVFYREDSDIASVNYIEENPEILYEQNNGTMSSEELFEIYSTKEDNYVSDWYKEESSTSHKIDYSLRPEEEIIFYYNFSELYFSNLNFSRPGSFTNGILKTLLAESENTLTIELPYPILGAEVKCGEGCGPSFSFSKGGKSWISVSEYCEGGRIDFTPLFTNGYGSPDYTYYFQHSGAGNCTLHSQFQAAPKSIPRLKKGENSVSSKNKDFVFSFGFE